MPIKFVPSMTDLLFTPSNNIGGSLLLKFAPVAGIQAMSAPATSVQFRTGYRWYAAYGTPGTKGFEEDEEETDNGPVWTVRLTAFLPGDSAERRQALAEMVRHRFVVEVEDNAGLRRRVGSLAEPLQFSYKFTTGEQTADRRGATLTFRGSLTRPALVVL